MRRLRERRSLDRIGCHRDSEALNASESHFGSLVVVGSPAPFHWVAGVAERGPVESTFGAVAVIALERVLFGLNHVRGRPVHPRLGEAVTAAIFEAGGCFGQLEGI